MSCYIIKDSEGFSAYYYNNCNIFKRDFNKAMPVILASDTRENFSADGKYLFYQLISGDICMGNRVILKNTAHSSPNIVINLIPFERLRIIYNIVENNENMLYTQIKRGDNHWSLPEKTDRLYALSNIYNIADLGNNVYILIYAKKMPELQLGFREIYAHSIGEFKHIYATGYNIKDYSYVITKEAMHFVFIQSAGFTERIVYVRRDNAGRSAPITLYEGFNIKKCLLGIIKNKLCVWWEAGRTVSRRSSYDFGLSFNKIEIERDINAEGLTKAVFKDKTYANEDNYIFNEIYCNRERGYRPYFVM